MLHPEHQVRNADEILRLIIKLRILFQPFQDKNASRGKQAIGCDHDKQNTHKQYIYGIACRLCGECQRISGDQCDDSKKENDYFYLRLFLPCLIIL